jgi:hypothetical protein
VTNRGFPPIENPKSKIENLYPMPAKSTASTNAAGCAAEIERRLPRSLLLMRGHIVAAFGLSDYEWRALRRAGVFHPVRLPRVRGLRYERFARADVVATARQWETPAA